MVCNGPLQTTSHAGPFKQHRRPHIQVLVAQFRFVTADAEFRFAAFQQLNDVPDEVVVGLQWVLGIGFPVERKNGGASGEECDTGFREGFCPGHCAERFHLQPQHTEIVPVVGIFQPVGMVVDVGPCSPSP